MGIYITMSTQTWRWYRCDMSPRICIFIYIYIHIYGIYDVCICEIHVWSVMYVYVKCMCTYINISIQTWQWCRSDMSLRMALQPYDIYVYMWSACIYSSTYQYKHGGDVGVTCHLPWRFHDVIWQFPLELLHPRNPTNRETHIPRYLALQIQMEILV